MRASVMTPAAALLAFAAAASATGMAVVNNQCSYPVYLWSVSNVAGDMVTIPSNGGSYSETYRTNPNGGGISMKMASTTDLSGAITQFEYTLDSTLWYDVSNINGYPFMESGLTAVPSISSCPAITCPAGVAACAEAYNIPSDNFATAACTPDSNIVLVLCSDQQGTGANAGASSAASSAVASVTSSATSSAAAIDFTPLSVAKAHVASAVRVAHPSRPTGLNLLNLDDVTAEVVENNVVVVTTFVTEYLKPRVAEPTAAPDARVAERKARRHLHHPHQAREHHA